MSRRLPTREGDRRRCQAQGGISGVLMTMAEADVGDLVAEAMTARSSRQTA
ncbi:hypothetical protein [Rubellimicrobium rubrum]|uniref:hypothetical protein n=1 Tax=Rubellimicrobium rubrum TaxID=2585369 RepID=UPI00159B93AA|nr:hypothetical protein [Rubellimicrobium rubrum]